jgi:hypothetical protein
MSETGSGRRQDETRVADSQDQDALSHPVREIDNISRLSEHHLPRQLKTEARDRENLTTSHMVRFAASRLLSLSRSVQKRISSSCWIGL